VFDINGLTITCNMETGDEEVILTTSEDVSGIYDMVKGFIKEYNALINEFDTLYNAPSSKGYSPLTNEEKDALSEKEIEEWEKKIKDSILRNNSTLGTISSAFKEIMSAGYNVGGKTVYLFDFGISKLGFFNASDNEKNAFHIDGDADYVSVKNNENKLMDFVTKDPNMIRDFLNVLTRALYDKVSTLSTSIDGYRTKYSVYDDKKMKEDYTGYNDKIKKMEDKLKAYEDKWYSKFSAMETAMARMQTNASAIAGLLGMVGGGK
jgi:flagellar hook-associated protein 2